MVMKDDNRKIIQILTHSLSNLFPSTLVSSTISDLPYGGGWHVRLARQIRKYYKEYEIECWGMEKKIDKPIIFKDNGITCRIFPSKYFKYIGEISLPLLRELKKQIIQHDVLIHIHGVFNYTSYVAPILLRNEPIVVQHHGDKSGLQKFQENTHKDWKSLVNLGLYLIKLEWLFERFAFPKVDKFFVLNSEAKNYLSKMVGAEKVEVLTMGIDFEVFRKMDKINARKTLGLELDKKYILFVGAFVRVKGLNYLIQSLPHILKEHPNTVLLLVGEGYYKNELRRLIKSLRLEDNVIFVPWVKNEILPLYYNAADVFVLPSLSEGLPVVGIEALACETPFIGTNVGGIPDIVKTFKAGILIPPKNPDAIANAVIKVLNGEVSFKVDRENAKKRFDWRYIVKRVVEVYEDLFEKYYG